MKKILATLLLPVGIFCAVGIANAGIMDYIGDYDCKGHDPYLNMDYTGHISIKTHGDVYKVTMEFTKGKNHKEKLVGSAIANATGDTLAVASHLVGSKKYGLSAFGINPDGKTLSNDWMYVDGDKIATETCVRRK